MAHRPRSAPLVAADSIAETEVPALPGLRFRPYRGLEDIPAMAPVLNDAVRATGSSETHSVDEMAAFYQNLTNCDPGQDIVIAELGESIVGYARTWWTDRSEGGRGFQGYELVAPEHAERGVEDAFLAIGIRRQLAQAAAMATELSRRPAYLVRWARGGQRSAVDRLERQGFRLTRRWAEMMRPDFHEIPKMPAPAGFELRRVSASDPDALRRAWDINVEAFRDHYGEGVPTETDWRAFATSPQTQPQLWCVAFHRETGEVAGHILNFLGDPDPDGSLTGWTESIAVRAPYRRLGLAGAMLAESLRIVRDAGAARAALGVDLANPSQALTLYERLGFRVTVEDLEFHRSIDLAEGPR
jgi:mycothiol synthase